MDPKLVFMLYGRALELYKYKHETQLVIEQTEQLVYDESPWYKKIYRTNPNGLDRFVTVAKSEILAMYIDKIKIELTAMQKYHGYIPPLEDIQEVVHFLVDNE